jgi:hypothetical protein
MKRLLLLIVLGAVGFYLYKNGLPGSGSRIEVAADGSELKLETQAGGTATFAIGEGFEDTYLVWGAHEGCSDSRGSCGSLTVLPLGIATSLARRYPDFTRCASPGAAEGKANTYTLQLLVPDSKTQRAIGEIATDHERRVRESGERLCVTVRGSYVDFVQVELGGTTLTAAQVPKPPAGALQQYFVWPKSVEAHECPPLV